MYICIFIFMMTPFLPLQNHRVFKTIKEDWSFFALHLKKEIIFKKNQKSSLVMS